MGVEIGSISILTTFLMDLRGFNQVTSKIGLIVFLGGMATGRLVLGLYTSKRQIWLYILEILIMKIILMLRPRSRRPARGLGRY